MRRITLFPVCVLAACASAGGSVSGSDAGVQRTAIYSGTDGTLYADAPRAEATTIAAPPDLVWLAVKKVYADLDIPVTVDNPQGHQLGNINFFKTRQMGGERMTTLVNCGNGMTGPNAASFRINMSLLTDVNPDGKGGTKVQTTFQAKGQDVTAGSADQIHCGSTGHVELMVLERVKAVVGKS